MDKLAVTLADIEAARRVIGARFEDRHVGEDHAGVLARDLDVVLLAAGPFAEGREVEPGHAILVAARGDGPVVDGQRAGLAGLLAHQVGYEQLSFWRNPQSAIFTFLFPVVLVFLEIVGVLHTAQLRKVRRFAILGISIFAAVITPSSDPYTMLALMIPMVLFYEAAIIIGRLMKK